MKGLRFTRLFAAAMLLASTAALFALDLPTRKVNGEDCYYYTVKNQETIYGVSTKLGISRAAILKYNPGAADGLREGMRLYFPVKDFGSGYGNATSTVKHTVKKGETLFGIANKYNSSVDAILALNPSANSGVKEGQTLLIPGMSEDVVDDTAAEPRQPVNTPAAEPEVIHVGEAPEVDTLSIVKADSVAPAEDEDASPFAPSSYVQRHTVAVMMPFMLDEEKVSKPANLATDFYKGLLVAADSLGASAPAVDILVYDTNNSTQRVRHYLDNEPRLRQADLIIAPDNAEHLALIADFGKRNNITVLNNFVVRDTTYVGNPMVLQTNIPSNNMYRLALDAFMSNLGTMTPVILDNLSGRHDKAPFIEMLKQRLDNEGIMPIVVEYDGNLHNETLVEQLGEPNENSRFMFIPTSGNLGEFNKLAPGLEKYRQNAYLQGGEIRLFGFPEYTTFRGDALESLHKLDTTIYSRFFLDTTSSGYKNVNESFIRHFGRGMADGVPAQGLLGFDTGNYIFNVLAGNPVNFRTGASESWNGVQNSFMFADTENTEGKVNRSIYIIRYLPGDAIDSIVLH